MKKDCVLLEYLYIVNFKHDESGKILSLPVWALNVNMVASNLSLFEHAGYSYLGILMTYYGDGNRVTREV